MSWREALGSTPLFAHRSKSLFKKRKQRILRDFGQEVTYHGVGKSLWHGKSLPALANQQEIVGNAGFAVNTRERSAETTESSGKAGFRIRLRRSLRPALGRCLWDGWNLCHRVGRCQCHWRGRGWLINVDVRRRIRPRQDIPDSTERQVSGAEYHSRHLSKLFRIRPELCSAGEFSVCRVLNARYILFHSAERDYPPLGALPGQVCNGPASREWQAPEQQSNTACPTGHLIVPLERARG